MREQIKPQHWAVEVRVDGVEILTIESGCYGGVSNIEDYADAVRNCAEHLMAFIGPSEPGPCFLCDEEHPEQCQCCQLGLGETENNK